MRKCLLFMFLGFWFGQECMGSAAFSESVQIRSGFIMVQAEVNGQTGQYILDTGAPGLIFNSRYLAESRKNNHQGVESVNGNFLAARTGSWTFYWSGFTGQGTESYAIDLTYLERSVDCRVDGLIGLDVFHGYYVVIDYASESLELREKIPDAFAAYPSVSLALEFQDHVPVVILYHSNRAYRFAMDSGSRSHLLDARACTAMAASIHNLDAVDLVGADQTIIRTTRIEATGLTTAGIALPPTQFVVADLAHMGGTNGTQIDGVLGQPLFEDRVVLIDKDRKFVRLSAKLPVPGAFESLAASF